MAPSLPSLFSKSGYGVTLGFFLYNLPVKRELKTIEMGKMAELGFKTEGPGMSWKAPLSLLLSWSSSATQGSGLGQYELHGF